MNAKQSLKKVWLTVEKGLPFLCVVFFLGGIWLSRISENFTRLVDVLIGGFVDNYQVLAPFAIYLIVTPAFASPAQVTMYSGRFSIRSATQSPWRRP